MQIVLKPIRAAVNRNKKMADTRASDLVIALDGDESEVSTDLMDEIQVHEIWLKKFGKTKIG